MKRTPIQPTLSDFPELLQPLLRDCTVYDSSCSRAARVFFLDGDGGLFLKKAPRGTLKAEAEMTGYFHRKGLGAEVLSYLTREDDWLLTRQLSGVDFEKSGNPRCADCRILQRIVSGHCSIPQWRRG